MVKIVLIIVIIFLFSFVFALIMHKLEGQQSSLGDMEGFCKNKVNSKFDTDEKEISIDEAINKEFKLLDL